MSRRVLIACVAACVATAGLALGLREPKEQGSGKPFLEEPWTARTVSGTKIDLRSPDRGASVVIFNAPRDLASPRTAEALRQAHPANRVQVVDICVGDVPPQGLPPLLSVIDDRDAKLARRFGVGDLPEAFVLVGDGRLSYRGTLDGIDEALASALSGHAPAAISDQAIATHRPAPPIVTTPTFYGDVEPILRRSCRSCHQPGQSAPFSLITHAQAAKRAGDLADVAERRLMPPWKPDPAESPPLLHDRTLLADEIATLRAWADAGAPAGQALSRTPEPAAASINPSGWALGEPDLILEMPEEFAIPAEGGDVYRCFVMPTNEPTDRAITAIEVQPGNPRVVHHTFSYLDVRGLGRERDTSDPGPGYMCFSGFTGDRIFGALGGWTPGNEAHFYGEGIGLNLPKGADVVMQVHYHPSGKPETDRTRLGIHFARKPIRQSLQWISACADPETFELPPDESRILVEAELTIPMDVDLHAITPHMHLLGRMITASVNTPDGRTRPLIHIDDWDFNRQDTYYLREPMHLPEGSVIRVLARFDNSAGNARNPSSPPKGVRWGEATTDDMMILFLALTRSGQDLTQPGSKDDFMDEFFRRAASLPGTSAAKTTEAPPDKPAN
ncbi:AhpC/TSA family protein [Isosphaeraceae bacterium EP7]